MRFDAEAFRHQALPRYGRANPERAEIALWSHMMSTEAWWTEIAVPARAVVAPPPCELQGQSASRESSEYGPLWAPPALRFGCARVQLDDGRRLHIAGEHEDWYDPDFCIYNDLIVETAGGDLAFYLYPKHVFPPTDFHTATRVGDTIILLGSLGYPDMRQPGKTQALALSLADYSIRPLDTSGENPGWISRHEAILEGDAIVVDDGYIPGIDDDGKPTYRANPDMFALDLKTMVWHRIR